ARRAGAVPAPGANEARRARTRGWPATGSARPGDAARSRPPSPAVAAWTGGATGMGSWPRHRVAAYREDSVHALVAGSRVGTARPARIRAGHADLVQPERGDSARHRPAGTPTRACSRAAAR